MTANREDEVLKVDELVSRAHQNARDKGFWNACEEATAIPVNVSLDTKCEVEDAFVCQKLALIATEVAEFEDEAHSETSASSPESLEELADVCIRIFDLCGHLEDVPLSRRLFESEAHRENFGHRELAHLLYREIADATRAHRKNHMIVMSNCFDEAIRAAVDYCWMTFGEDALLREVERKMRKNKARPHMHGRKY